MLHTPVLLKEIIQYLDPKPGDMIVDATLDGGGHAMALAEKVVPDGKVLGIEWDSELLKEFELKVSAGGGSAFGGKSSKFKDNLILVNDSYVNLENIVREYNFRPKGILFDLGLSSWHYEKSGRGFSFRKDEPLDMRYCTRTNTDTEDTRTDTDIEGTRTDADETGRYKSVSSQHKSVCSITAAEVVNTYSKEELEKIFREYGEEQFAKSIAGNIVSARREKLITTTTELVEVINISVPAWYKKRKIHFATKTFQALRIEVNSELENVEKGVSSAIDVLNPPEAGRQGGRLAVISFHGLEDKMVREIFKKKAKEGIVKFVVKGTVRPKWEEIKDNPRARSAKLKIIEKI